MKIEYTDNIDLRAWLGRWEQNNKKFLYEIGLEVHKDILADSRKKKTGRVYNLPNGREHIAANKAAGETTARMTGAQNSARGFYSDKQQTTWGVDRSIPYAQKNENEYHDIEKGITRNQNKMVAIVSNRIDKFLNE